MYITKHISATSKRDEMSDIVNGEKLAQDIDKQLKEFDEEGITLFSITPITSASYELENDSFSGGGAGYGYSYTSGVIIVGKK
jgi:hypothetical protein